MASYKKREGKGGVSYKITVSLGRDINGKQIRATKTWKPSRPMSEKQMEKEVSRAAVLFEEEVRSGIAADHRQQFADYAAYVIQLKERSGIKRKTLERYQSFLERIAPIIGHIKLCDLRPMHLNNLYERLGREGENKRTGGTLSAKTILEHHRFISTVLSQAEKEMLIPYNVAKKATPPKVKTKEANYFQESEVEKIRLCLEEEIQQEAEYYKRLAEKYPKRNYENPQVKLKWKTIVYLFLLTGMRRGELAGLKWDRIDLERGVLRTENNLLYSPSVGMYDDTPKTDTSIRTITIPFEMVELLKEYRKWYDREREKCGDRWNDSDYVFVQKDGRPMHPDSITSWMNRFSQRHDLPHINPHAFRHTHASILLNNEVDLITTSKRLGHAKVSTTSDIYAHLMEKADEAASDAVAERIFRK